MKKIFIYFLFFSTSILLTACSEIDFRYSYSKQIQDNKVVYRIKGKLSPKYELEYKNDIFKPNDNRTVIFTIDFDSLLEGENEVSIKVGKPNKDKQEKFIYINKIYEPIEYEISQRLEMIDDNTGIVTLSVVTDENNEVILNDFAEAEVIGTSRNFKKEVIDIFSPENLNFSFLAKGSITNLEGTTEDIEINHIFEIPQVIIDVKEEVDGKTFDYSKVLFEGVTEPKTNISVLKGDIEVFKQLSNGTFALDLHLEEGLNEYTIIATKQYRKENSKKITVTKKLSEIEEELIKNPQYKILDEVLWDSGNKVQNHRQILIINPLNEEAIKNALIKELNLIKKKLQGNIW